MALAQLTPEETRTWTREEKDRWWFEKIYRGDLPQLTIRSGLTGFLLGGVLSATNLYVSARSEQLESCQRELAILEALAAALALPADSSGSPIAARAFAETLIFCPDADKAKKQMQADRAGAAAFLDLAEWFVAQAASGAIQCGSALPQPRGCLSTE